MTSKPTIIVKKAERNTQAMYNKWWEEKALVFFSNINTVPMLMHLGTALTYPDSKVREQSINNGVFPYRIYIGSTFSEDGQDYFNYQELTTVPKHLTYNQFKDLVKDKLRASGVALGNKLINQFHIVIPLGYELTEEYLGKLLNEYRVWTPLGNMIHESTTLPTVIQNIIASTVNHYVATSTRNQLRSNRP
jgi:hypothetical protein